MHGTGWGKSVYVGFAPGIPRLNIPNLTREQLDACAPLVMSTALLRSLLGELRWGWPGLDLEALDSAVS